jgi:rubrerythrin
VIAAAADKLRERRQAAKADLACVLRLADTLFAAATAQLEDVRRQLSEAMVGVADEFEANVATCGNDDEERRHWFRHQVIEAARLLDYFADLRTYHSWLRLRLREQSQTEVLVSFHGLGQTFSGVLACGVCGYRREETEDDLRPVVAGLEVACPEVFQFNYRDEESGLAERFGRWLHDSLAVALEQWRRGL